MAASPGTGQQHHPAGRPGGIHGLGPLAHRPGAVERTVRRLARDRFRNPVRLPDLVGLRGLAGLLGRVFSIRQMLIADAAPQQMFQPPEGPGVSPAPRHENGDDLVKSMQFIQGRLAGWRRASERQERQRPSPAPVPLQTGKHPSRSLKTLIRRAGRTFQKIALTRGQHRDQPRELGEEEFSCRGEIPRCRGQVDLGCGKVLLRCGKVLTRFGEVPPRLGETVPGQGQFVLYWRQQGPHRRARWP